MGKFCVNESKTHSFKHDLKDNMFVCVCLLVRYIQDLC